jgi:hypothetical protein
LLRVAGAMLLPIPAALPLLMLLMPRAPAPLRRAKTW